MKSYKCFLVLRMKACRILVNTPSAEGSIGNIYNEMIPSLTLGCGSLGKTLFLKTYQPLAQLILKR